MKLNSKVALSMWLVALLPLAAFGWAALRLAQANLTKEVEEQLQLTAELTMHRIKMLADGYAERLRLCRSRTQLRTSLKEFIRSRATHERDEMNQTLSDILPEIESFETISVTDPTGVIVASTSPELIGENLGASQVFLQARTGIQVNQLFIHEGVVKLNLSGPLMSEDEYLGSIIIRSTVEDLFSVLARRTGLGHTGEILLADRTADGDARVINPLRHAPNAPLQRVVPKADRHDPITQAMLKIRRSMNDPVDYRGVPVLAATDYINSPDWGLVVKIDKTEALQPIKKLARSYYAALATTTGIALIIGLAVSRFLIRPIIRLSQSAQRVQRGEFTHRAEENRTDELGQLARSFNAMSNELIQLNENLEERVRQRTEELQETNHTLRRTQEKLERFNHELEDIVKERAAELKSSEERFYLVAQGAVGGIWDWNITNGDCSFSDLWLEQLGYMRDELAAKQEAWIALLHPDDKPLVVDRLQKHLDEHAPCDIECRLRAHNDEYRWFRCCGQAQWSSTGEPVRMVGSHTDITEQKRNQTAVLESQKLESLGILAGGIAHDFNNILTAIVGNISLAKTEIPPSSALEPVLGDVENAALRAAELCNQMLAYSGQGRFEVLDLNLNDIIRDMENLLQISVSKTAVLKFELVENLPATPVDASQIRQVIMNLVINASEAIGERSGIINVATGLARVDAEYLIRTHLAPELPPGDYVYLEVSDSGCGMDKETMNRIFDPFFTTKFTGRGLGLAALLGIVRAHHGALKVYSEPGNGTTFKILLPCSDADAQPIADTPETDRQLEGAGTVLIVDDEETVRATAARILTRCGFDVVLAKDGRHAVEKFKLRPDDFRFVLLDLTMPQMNGVEAFGAMKLLRPDLPVILMSGYNEQAAVERFAGRGLAGFIQKPFQMQSLVDRIRTLLEDNKTE